MGAELVLVVVSVGVVVVVDVVVTGVCCAKAGSARARAAESTSIFRVFIMESFGRRFEFARGDTARNVPA
jgi:hypothetical protein